MNESQAIPASAVRGNTRAVFSLALIVTVGLIVLFGVRLVQAKEGPLATGMAPSWELKTFEGQTLRLSDLRGKPVVLNFWASWCQPCRQEAPLLEAAWEQYKTQNLLVIGVDYVDTEPEAKKYLQEFKITYPNGPDRGTVISQAYHITGVPETYFITREGKLLGGVDANGKPYGNWIGPIPEAALRERVERLLTQ